MHRTSERILMDHELSEGSRVARMKSAVADRYDRGRDYVREHSARDIAGDAGRFARNHPIPSILTGVAIGFLVYRLFSRSDASRHSRADDPRHSRADNPRRP